MKRTQKIYDTYTDHTKTAKMTVVSGLCSGAGTFFEQGVGAENITHKCRFTPKLTIICISQ